MEKDLELKFVQDWMEEILSGRKLIEKARFNESGWCNEKRGDLKREKSKESRELKFFAMRKICRHFSNPERGYKTVHVAGSKGKGTIASEISAGLQAAGKKTGVFLSPHVEYFSERIRDGKGEMFQEETYRTAFLELKEGIEEMLSRGEILREEMGWFQIVTVFAMLVFRRAGVEYGVFEVGIGGSVDATNVIVPEAIGVGVVEREHTRILGDSLAKIAREKAGVFKRETPVVSVPQERVVEEVFSEVAKVKVQGGSVKYVSGETYVEQDREVAKEVLKILIPEVEEGTYLPAVEAVRLPGRYEIVKNTAEFSGVPYILLEGAHTIKSVEAAILRMKAEGRRGVVGYFEKREGKDAEKKRIIRESGVAEEMVEIRGERREGIEDTLKRADSLEKPAIFIGSFYGVGEVKKRLRV